MKTRWYNILFLTVAMWQTAAQDLPMQRLDEVVVSDMRLTHYTDGHKLTVLQDSTIARNGIFLTDLLRFNTNIYLKENGFGMVSSPSFRGTNASHTAVVWNGIAINSQLNGQTDFNTINPFGYSTVAIRSGGGSVQFGSGAIGGSVHLNNELRFKKHSEHEVHAGYGSFNTRSANYKASFGSEKWSASAGVNYNGSENNYRYLQTDARNENGAFEHLNINANAGYLINAKNLLRVYHQSFIGDRNLSGNLVAIGRSRYEDTQHRTQAEWSHFTTNVSSSLKLAHLYEDFKFFENKDSDLFSDGRVTTLLVRYALDFAFSDALRLHSFVEYNNYNAAGTSFGAPSRNDVALTSLFKHTVSPKLRYTLSLRQDFSSDFTAPIVFAGAASYTMTPAYEVQLNASRNFRAPTFNDLYWQPGGNINLLPEQSYQVDLGHQFRYRPLSINLNTYYINTANMIRWLPNASGIWSPENVDSVAIYGAEVTTAMKTKIGDSQELNFQGNYAYTVSQDTSTGKQLIYVPLHSANVSVAYRRKCVSVFYQQLYTGAVSIIGGALEDYTVANLGVTYTIETKGKLSCRLGITLNNVFDTYYENVALRPMPNRNIQTQLIFNF